VARKIKLLSVVLILLLVVSTVFTVKKLTEASAGKLTVVIDAGHGGIDGGVVASNGIKESELNLDIAKKIESRLKGYGINVVMTRTGSGGLYGLATKGFKKRDMQKRKEIINSSGADLVVSIHINKCPFSYRKGAQVFYKLGDEKSKNFAYFMQNNLNQMPTATQKGLSLVGDYYILNCSSIPSVLVECGFLSNSEDEKLLLDEDYRYSLSGVISSSILTYLLSTNSQILALLQGEQ
jgi:N-acetylmuramoyl-L-alanine amidase